MRIFHISTLADWRAAQKSGSYTTSTLGRTLAEEGFIHASRGDQWQGVRERFYADVDEPLVLLAIDTDLLASPIVEEEVGDSRETFPHVYGPINPSAVVGTVPLDGRPVSSPSFSQLFLTELFRNVLVASAVLALVVAATFLGMALDAEWGPITGALLGLVLGVLGVLGVRAVGRRRPG